MNTSILQQLYEYARERCLQEFLTLGLTKKDFTQIEKRIRGGVREDMALLDLTDRILRIGKAHAEPEHGIVGMDSLVRAFQMMTNYTPREGVPVEVATIFLEYITFFKQEGGYSKPDDVEKFVRLVLSAHQSIDAFAKKHHVDSRISSIAHHVLHWYLQESPHLACRKTPEKLAMIAYAIVRRFQETATEKYFSDYSPEDLVRWGGLKNVASLTSSTSAAFHDVVYGVYDIDLLFVDPVNRPSDWRERLVKVAPALQERFSQPASFLDDPVLPAFPFDDIEEVKERMMNTLQKCVTNNALTLEKLQQYVWEASDHEDPEQAAQTYMKLCLPHISPQIEDDTTLRAIMTAFLDAWNIFPHQQLQGKSPRDMMNEQL
ncbi:MAG: hypothetical protein HYV32_00330 [Candidatus Kerfeldbacteria bacterium]|nr:hypothetical protein [Candidatus Kerfeldbacteria bacterium]